VNAHGTQQVWVDLVLRVLPARLGLSVQRLDTHARHQRGDVLAADLWALTVA